VGKIFSKNKKLCGNVTMNSLLEIIIIIIKPLKKLGHFFFKIWDFVTLYSLFNFWDWNFVRFCHKKNRWCHRSFVVNVMFKLKINVYNFIIFVESTQKLLHTHEKDRKIEPLKHIEILMVEPWECFENNSW